MRFLLLLTFLLILSCSRYTKTELHQSKADYDSAITLQKAEKFAEALPFYAKVLQNTDYYLWAQYGLHQCLYFTGEVDSAINGMKKLSRLPTDTTGYNTTNYIYYKSNHFLAMHYYEEAIAHKNPEMLREAFEYVKRAISVHSSDEGRLLLLYIYLKTKNYNKILTDYYIHRNHIKDSNDYSDEFNLLYAITLLHKNEIHTALRIHFNLNKTYPKGLRYNIEEISLFLDIKRNELKRLKEELEHRR